MLNELKDTQNMFVGARNIFAHNFLNIQLIFSIQKKVLES